MRSRKILRQTAREWFCGLTCLSLILAPMAGCPAGDGGDDGGGDPKSAPGLYINDDNNADAVVGARAADGAVFFVFGARGPNGGLNRIDSIAVTTADAKDAFVTFESGRPVHAQGPDGSYLHISYSNVTPTSLDADIDLFDAATATTTNYQTSIDLEQTAAQVAALVQERTGLDITPITVLDDNTIQTGKTHGRSLSIVMLPLIAIVVIPLAGAILGLSTILGQVLYAVFSVVAAAIQVVLIVILSPIFLIAEIFSGAVVSVRFMTLNEIFDFVPYPPVCLPCENS